MVNYSNGKIYKIEPIGGGDVGDVYIVSTTNEYLSQRMVQHRSDYRRWKNGKGSNVTSFQLFEKFGIEKCQITLIDLVNATSKDDLHTRERHYIQSLPCVNRYVPLRTNSEYYQANRPRISEYQTKYYQANKEKCREYQQAFNENNPEYNTEYREANKKKIAEYYQTNKERFHEQQRLYRQINKVQLAKNKRLYRQANKEQLAKKKRLYLQRNKQKIADGSSIVAVAVAPESSHSTGSRNNG